MGVLIHEKYTEITKNFELKCNRKLWNTQKCHLILKIQRKEKFQLSKSNFLLSMRTYLKLIFALESKRFTFNRSKPPGIYCQSRVFENTQQLKTHCPTRIRQTKIIRFALVFSSHTHAYVFNLLKELSLGLCIFWQWDFRGGKLSSANGKAFMCDTLYLCIYSQQLRSFLTTTCANEKQSLLLPVVFNLVN